MNSIMDDIGRDLADDIRQLEDEAFLNTALRNSFGLQQIVNVPAPAWAKPMKFHGTITGRINSQGIPVWGNPQYHKDPAGYSEFAIHTMLDKYLIQILSGEENDILQINEHIKNTLTIWLRCLYHPDYNPLREPIKAVKAIIEDDEYTLIMIGL